MVDNSDGKKEESSASHEETHQKESNSLPPGDGGGFGEGGGDARQCDELVINSESDAFKVLEAALNRELGDLPCSIRFDGWPILTIKLEGKGYDSTITSDMASGLVELQHAINRAYARAVHSSTNARVLTDHERKEIQFKAKVQQGSSLIEVNLGEFAETAATALVGKMEPVHWVVTVIGLATVAGSVAAYKAYLRHRSEDKKLSDGAARDIALSQEETRRLQVMANATREVPLLRHAQEDFDEARHGIVKGTSDAQQLTVSGVPLDHTSAQIITMAKRTTSRELQLNGHYEIRKVEWPQAGEVRLTVYNVDTHREFSASLHDDSLDQKQTALLQEAEWKRSTIYLSINATELRGEITKATIVGVQPVRSEPPDDVATASE